MHPWRFFSLFLLLASSTISAYFGAKFGYEMWLYTSLASTSPAKVLRWDIEEEGSRYAIWALYEYTYQGKTLTDRARIPGLPFLNEGAAETELRAQSKRPLTVYFSSTRSALGREFPTSYGIRCIISFLVLIYFLIFKKKLKSIFNE